MRPIVLHPAEGGGDDIPQFGAYNEEANTITYCDSFEKLLYQPNVYQRFPIWSTLRQPQTPGVMRTRHGRIVPGEITIRIDGRSYFYSGEYDENTKYTYRKMDPRIYL